MTCGLGEVKVTDPKLINPCAAYRNLETISNRHLTRDWQCRKNQSRQDAYGRGCCWPQQTFVMSMQSRKFMEHKKSILSLKMPAKGQSYVRVLQAIVPSISRLQEIARTMASRHKSHLLEDDGSCRCAHAAAPSSRTLRPIFVPLLFAVWNHM